MTGKERETSEEDAGAETRDKDNGRCESDTLLPRLSGVLVPSLACFLFSTKYSRGWGGAAGARAACHAEER